MKLVVTGDVPEATRKYMQAYVDRIVETPSFQAEWARAFLESALYGKAAPASDQVIEDIIAELR